MADGARKCKYAHGAAEPVSSHPVHLPVSSIHSVIHDSGSHPENLIEEAMKGYEANRQNPEVPGSQSHLRLGFAPSCRLLGC